MKFTSAAFRKLSLLLSLFLAIGSTQAQYTLQGKATDANAIPLPGAHIALQYPWGEDAKLGVTEADGSFKLTDIEQGGYKLKISFLGFEDLIREVTFNTQSIDLGILQLETAATQLAEVQVKEQVLTATQQGDTTSFNADAFKVMKDASAEDLVGKMPTVSVQGGKVQAQGEDVKQVLVDGKPFFGKDPTAALRNLPAEVIEKVQIYDQLSDQAQFTGFNDGNTSKTINIITRPNMRAGQFGKVYAGYGYDDKWQGGGNVNYFEGNRRISLIGMTNNINIQNFSSEDLAGAMGGGGGGFRRGGGGGSWGGGGGDFLVSSSGGVATTHALGLNYSDKWGEKMEVSGSYFFNNSSNRAEQVVSRQFVNAEGPGQVYDESSLTLNNNTNHRANFRFEYKIDSSNSLIMRPNLSVQLNNGDVGTNGVTALKDLLLNSNNSDYHSDLKALNVSNNLLWRHKFAREGRTFSINLSGGYAPKSGNYRLQSLNAFFPPLPPGIFDTLNQQAGLDAGNWNTSANISYTEPLGKVSQLQLEYQASYQQEESDRETYDFSPATGLFDQLNEPLSNVFSNDYYTHRPSLGYNYRKENLTITARGAWQHASLLNDQTFPQVLETEQRFSNFLPFAMVRWDINGRAKNLRLFYRTYTNLPSIEQLQNVVDNSNPLQLRVGNPKLRQSYSHSLFWRYQATNTEKSTVFYAMLGGSLTDDFIANATYLANSGLPIFDEIGARPGAIITQPVNLSGNRSLRSFVTYGFPLRPIKSNLNLELSWNYARTPGLVNIDRNIARSNTYGAGLSLSSNISTRVDFTIAARPSFNRVNNSLRSGNDTEFFSQNSSIRFNWIILEGFVLRNDLTHQYFSGLSGADFNQNFWLWNFGIGKKLFKNERGEITLTVNDLLSQNRSISRTVTETYIQDTRTNALTRFIMMTFTYNIRHFGSQPARSWDGERRWEGGGRPPFMPPH